MIERKNMTDNNKVKCMICEKEMRIINTGHLSSHNLTLDEYREKFPNSPWRCEDMRLNMINSHKGHVSPIKGTKMNEERLKIHREAMKKREENRIAEGKPHPAKGRVVSEETKEKLRQANLGKSLPQETIDKIVATRKRNGKKYTKAPHTEETKEKLREYNRNMREERNKELIEKYKLKAEESNLIILDYWNSNHNKLSGNLKCTICNTEFERTLQVFNECKFHTEICPVCFPPIAGYSYQEKELLDNIKSFYSGIIKENDRYILGNKKEIDIYIPETNLAIEYCGMYWHSEKMGKDQYYHVDKYQLCKEKGIKLLTIFEYEWLNKKDIVLSILKAKLGIFEKRIQARKCEIKEIDHKLSKEFLIQNHLKGQDQSSVRYGLFFNDELVSIMTFSKKSLSRKINDWEISRFCNKLNYSVIGGASKLFSYFIRNNNPSKIITYSDLRYGEGNVYSQLGFVQQQNTVPGYWYFKNNELELIHRFTLRKKSNEPKELTEKQLREKEGYLIIYDCGNAKYEWNKLN